MPLAGEFHAPPTIITEGFAPVHAQEGGFTLLYPKFCARFCARLSVQIAGCVFPDQIFCANYCAARNASVTYNQMVVYELDVSEIDSIFHAMADATRRDIVKRTMLHGQSVSELAKHYQMSFAAVQKHVVVLEKASLITKEKRGREQIVHPNPEMLRRAARLLDAYTDIWVQRVNRIEDVLLDQPKGTES